MDPGPRGFSGSRLARSLGAEEPRTDGKKKEDRVVTKSVAPPTNRENLHPWTFTAEQLLAHFTPGKTPRPQQTHFLERAAAAFAAGKRVVVGELPTGAGKTDACKTVANALRSIGKSTFMLTSQRILQDQYADDYPAPDIETLKGRANYACTHPSAEEGQDAADGVCRRRAKGILGECLTDDARPIAEAAQLTPMQAAVSLELPSGCHLCPYWAQLQRCHDAAISLFNFSSFLFQQRISRFPKRALMIVDEAHNCESQLMSFVTLELSEWALSLVGVRIDREIRTKAEFLDWLAETDLVALILRRLKAAENDAEDSMDSDDVDLSAAEVDALKELDGKLANFMAFLEKTEWVLEVVRYNDKRTGDERRKIVARPLYAKDFAQDLLFRHAERLVFMSATILDVQVLAKNLGLSMDEIELVRTPCDFPIENRPIYKDYCGNFGFKYFTAEQNPKDPTKPKFVRKVTEILERHRGQRGIVHCHSFSLSKILFDEVDTDRFLFQDHFDSKEAMLAEHARRTDSVIVAPAMHEGLDLKGDLSRFQVIAKMPWPNMQDRIIKRRMDMDSQWYAWLCALKIVQSYGRSVRSREDWAVTYILDAGFESFLWKNAKMLPDWFHEALRKGVPKEVRR
jgi:ATP-dependent DNA helicase DinG